MVSKSVPVKLKGGLEPRPVAMLVQLASQHDSTIHIEVDGKKVNAKSIMGMMSLGLDNGESLTVTADGTDEQAAVDDIESFLSGKN
ncbi:MAG: HPr family phosphocarrier protein [Lachnospiraceae bacterium]|nr:HPr family phosphocarrier protein [Lachnospiraceae bacterium]